MLDAHTPRLQMQAGTDSVEFVLERPAPSKNRAAKIRDGQSNEVVLPEAGVMLAVSLWLFERGASRVFIYPDGQHVKQFDIAAWLDRAGFDKVKPIGTTKHGGIYRCGDRALEVRFRPGCGDVVAVVDGEQVCVETKGGCINSAYAGEVSRLRSRMHEAVGSLFDPPETATRLIAAVPSHPATERLAKRMANRCRKAGVEIALVGKDGAVRLA